MFQRLSSWDGPFLSEQRVSIDIWGRQKGTRGVRLYPCETGEAETEWWGRLGEGALWGLKGHGKEWDNTQTHHSRQRTAKKNNNCRASALQRRLATDMLSENMPRSLSALRFRLKFGTFFSIQIIQKSSNSESQHCSMHIIQLIIYAVHQFLGIIGCLNVLVLDWNIHKHHAQALKWKHVHLKKKANTRTKDCRHVYGFKLRCIERNLLPRERTQAWLLADAMEVLSRPDPNYSHGEFSDMLTCRHAAVANWTKESIYATLFLFLMSDHRNNMQVLPVANSGYLCPSLQWAENELQREEKRKRQREHKMWCTCLWFWPLCSLLWSLKW